MKTIAIVHLTPCVFATARTLHTTKVATYEQLQSAGMAQNLSNLIDEAVAEQLARGGICVPEGKEQVLGENFSKLSEYNHALDAHLLVDRTMDFGLEDAILAWAPRLNPFRPNILSKEEYSNKYVFSGDYAVLGAGAYLRENLAPEMPDSVKAELAERLKSAAVIKADCKLYREQRTLALLASNAELVLEAYRRILAFRDDFRGQIRCVAETHRKTSSVRNAMLYFLGAPIAKHLKV